MSRETIVYSKDKSLHIWFGGTDCTNIAQLEELHDELEKDIERIETQIIAASKTQSENILIKAIGKAIANSYGTTQEDAKELHEIISDEDRIEWSEEYIKELLDEYYSCIYRLSRIDAMLDYDNKEQTKQNLIEQQNDDYWKDFNN